MPTIWMEVRHRLQEAHRQQKTQYDKKIKHGKLQYKVGDRVWVLRPIRGEDYKLVGPFHGPFIVEVVYKESGRLAVRRVDLGPPDAYIINREDCTRCLEEFQKDLVFTGTQIKYAKNGNFNDLPMGVTDDIRKRLRRQTAYTLTEEKEAQTE
jgi:hypothetical protein